MQKILKKITKLIKRPRTYHWQHPVLIIFTAIIIVAGLIYIFNQPKVVEATWWDDTWSYRQSITVTNSSGGQLTDFQVEILDDVDLSSLVSAGKLKSDLSDLRFTDVNHRVLPYWIEDDTNASVNAWVKIPSIPTTGTTIYMYYGNSSATDAQDGDATFEFFDGFSGSTIDTNKWASFGTVTIGSGIATINSGAYMRSIPTANSFLNDTRLSFEGLVKYNSIINRNSFGMVTSNYFGMSEMSSAAAGLNILRWTNNDYYHERANSTSGTETNVGDMGDIASYQRLKIIWDQATSAYFDTPIGPASRTDYIPNTETLYMHMNVLTESSMYLDWVFIRKTSSTEPTPTLNDDEANSPGPVGYWNFDEGYGTTAYDSTGYGNDGAISGATWVQNGARGRALSFNGTSNYVIASDKDLPSGNSDRTFNAWIKTDATLMDDWADVFSYGTGLNNNAILWTITDSSDTGKPFIGKWGANSGTANTAVNDDMWHMISVVITEDGVSDIAIAFYLDGKADGTSSLTSVDTVLSGAFNIATRPGHADYYFAGLIDEIRIYDRALSASEIKQLYNMNAGSFSTGRSELPRSCMDQLTQNPGSKSGVYMIDPGPGVDSFDVYCDMETDGGGWTMTMVATGEDGNSSTSGFWNGYDPWFTRTAKTSDSTNPLSSSDQFNLAFIYVPGDDILFKEDNTGYVLANDCFGDNLSLRDRFTAWVGWGADNTAKHTCSITSRTATSSMFVPQPTELAFLAVDVGHDTSGVIYTQVYAETYPTWHEEADCGFGTHENGATWTQETNAYDVGGNGTCDIGSDVNKAYSIFVRENEFSSTPGVALNLPFEGVSGSTTYDISGNGNNGTVSGAIWKTSANCKVGRCFEFDGNDYITLVNNSPAGSFSVAGWVKYGSSSDWQALYSAGVEIWFGFNSGSNTIRLHVGGSSDYSDASYDLEGDWHYIVGTWNGSVSHIYIDGIDKGLSTSGTPNNPVASSAMVGARSSSDDQFNGYLDEVKVFDRALTQREIMMEMNSGKHQPILDLSFDESGGTTAYDKSDFGNNGTLVNVPLWKTTENCVSGSCLDFNGSSQNVFLGYDIDINGFGSSTLEAWINLDVLDDDTYSVFGGYDTGRNTYHEIRKNGSEYYMTYWTQADGWKFANTAISAGRWYHVVWVWNGLKLTWYLNGENDGSYTFSSFGAYLPEVKSIGSMSGSQGDIRFFDGQIDGVKIYNYILTDNEIKQEYTQSKGQFGRTNAVGEKTTPGASCSDIHAKNSQLPNGVYWIDTTGGSISDAFQVYCDMETDGGGWTLIMQTSDSSAYTYSNAVWTNSSGGSTIAGNPNLNQDYVSNAFYTLSGTESRLALGNLSYWNSWTHANDTARDLANQTRMSGAQGSYGNCAARTNCGTEPINLKPQGVELGTSGTSSSAWHRFGYVNDANAWGQDIRVGFSGDNDSSDSTDTVMGLGLRCEGNCAATSATGDPHNTGSGYYFYHSWGNAPLDDAKQGWLWIRDAGTNTINTGPVIDMTFDKYSGGVYLDESGNGYNGTPSGSPDWKTAVNCKEGRCVDFDSGDYIGPINVNSWIRGVDYVTVTGWYYYDAQTDGAPWGIMTNTSPIGSADGFWWHTKYTGGNFYLRTEDNVSGESDITGTPFVSDDTWYYITTIVGTNKFDVYVNSQLYWSWSPAFSWANINSDTAYFSLGMSYSTGIDGRLDSVKLYNHALTQAEISELYNGGAPVGWWRFDEGVDNLCSDGADICDSSGEDNNGTISGNPVWITDTSSCKQGGCMSFDGDDYIDLNTSTVVGSEVSLGAWIKPTGNYTTYNAIIQKRDGSGASNDQYEIYLNTGNGYLGFYSDTVHTVAVTPTSNVWSHYLATLDSAGNLKFYLNGEQVGSTITGVSVGTKTTAHIYVGQVYNGGEDFYGSLDDIRIYNYALTAEQVKEIYNGGLIRFK